MLADLNLLSDVFEFMIAQLLHNYKVKFFYNKIIIFIIFTIKIKHTYNSQMMDPAVIIISNGVDDTLLGIDLKPFTFATISANDPKPMTERKVSYQYKTSSNPDGTNPKNYTHDMQVRTFYDLIQHVFPPHSSTIVEYLVPEQLWNGE